MVAVFERPVAVAVLILSAAYGTEEPVVGVGDDTLEVISCGELQVRYIYCLSAVQPFGIFTSVTVYGPGGRLLKVMLPSCLVVVMLKVG